MGLGLTYRIENKVKLKKVISLQIDNRGRNPKEYMEDSKHPVIDNYLIKNSRYPDLNNVNRFLSEEDYDNFLRGYLKKNDVLITLVGNGIGNVTMVPDTNCVIVQNTLGLRCNDKMLNEYLYYFLLYKQDSIKQFNRGTSQPSIRKTDLFSMEIPLPEINTQKKIANILSSFDDKIENNNAIIANLEEQAQAIFKSWFVDFEPFQEEEFVDSELGRIPSGWKAVRFDELIDFKNGYSFKSKELNDEQHYPDDLKVFKMGDIKVGGGINPNKTKSWVTREYVRNKKIEDFIAEKGLLLMCMTDMKNNVNLLGHTALINSSDEYIVNQRVGMIKPKLDSGITSSFLYVLTNNEKFLDELRARANSGVQVNLSTKEIKNTQVILPSVNVLNHFNQISESIVKLRYNLEKQNEKLTKIRDTLLPKLMSGEIRVEEAIEVE